MKSKELVTVLLFQAYCYWLAGDNAAAEDAIFAALSCHMTGFPYAIATAEVIQ